ncbi:MAG: methyltransferase domain-containing protein [Actinomycetota bacterium]|nr:methyltransferase domain-containing protein [Actinomycetota bacterium]
MAVHEAATTGFGRAPDAYERGRPGYPAEAVAWLAEQLDLGVGRRVLDVAAGTGKLTRPLTSTGAEVVAVEPVGAMRAVLERLVPNARALEGTAEALPVADAAFDGVVAAQAFHWFEGPVALAEFHRVLRPGGRLGLVWNRWLPADPLHQAITQIVEPHRGAAPAHRSGRWRDALDCSPLFAATAEQRVGFAQVLDAAGLVDRVASISFVAALGEAERRDVLDRVLALTPDAGRPVRLGYVTELFVYVRRSARLAR